MTSAKENLETAHARKLLEDIEAERKLRDARTAQGVPGGLIEFVRHFWSVIEPETRLVEGWLLEAIAAHLEGVTFGKITRLLINVPPGSMKSLMTQVFWPAWEWGAMNLPHYRYVSFSYSSGLTERDNLKFKKLVTSERFKQLYGDRFDLEKEGEIKITNSKTGSKFASSVKGIGTGERGDRVIIDDPHDVHKSESDVVRADTVRWFRETITDRLNNLDASAIVIIMQRVHQADISGFILEAGWPYCHLMVPMEFEPGREPYNPLGWVDPRTEEGDLAWPERFSPEAVANIEREKGSWAYAGQYQQRPAPRGGGIIKRAHWRPYTAEDCGRFGVSWPKFPVMSYTVLSIDTAQTEKKQNDPSAGVVLGVCSDIYDNQRLMLMYAWAARLEIYELVKEIEKTCRAFKVDRVLIEDKASGHPVAQELRRRGRTISDVMSFNPKTADRADFGVQLVSPEGDKVARMYAVQNLFEVGLIMAPAEATGGGDFLFKEFADKVICECEVMPKGEHDDLCLVAGTMIVTRRGEIPIERIAVGEEVLTPFGWRRVEACGFTGVRPVVQCGLLWGTSNHPVFTLAGWQPLDTISQGQRVLGLKLCDLIQTIRRLKFISTASVTGGWVGVASTISRKATAMPGVRVPRDCTLQYGKMPTALFRRATSFITEMATLSIAALKIWSACRSVCIGAWLKDVIIKKMLIHCGRLGGWLPSGIVPKPVALGIASTPRFPWSRLKLQYVERNENLSAVENVFGVEPYFHSAISEQSSAACIVNAPNLPSAEASRKNCIPILRPVFNLSVEGAHCYYANGLLVHNCDAMSQGLLHLRALGLARMPDEWEIDERSENTYRKQPVPLYPAFA